MVLMHILVHILNNSSTTVYHIIVIIILYCSALYSEASTGHYYSVLIGQKEIQSISSISRIEHPSTGIKMERKATTT